MSNDAEMRKPILQNFDAYGNRIDKIHTTEGWRFFKGQAAQEGLISIPYNGGSRVHQVAKLYLFNPSSGMYSCPLAMTDGAAFTLRFLKREKS